MRAAWMAGLVFLLTPIAFPAGDEALDRKGVPALGSRKAVFEGPLPGPKTEEPQRPQVQSGKASVSEGLVRGGKPAGFEGPLQGPAPEPGSPYDPECGVLNEAIGVPAPGEDEQAPTPPPACIGQELGRCGDYFIDPKSGQAFKMEENEDGTSTQTTYNPDRTVSVSSLDKERRPMETVTRDAEGKLLAQESYSYGEKEISRYVRRDLKEGTIFAQDYDQEGKPAAYVVKDEKSGMVLTSAKFDPSGGSTVESFQEDGGKVIQAVNPKGKPERISYYDSSGVLTQETTVTQDGKVQTTLNFKDGKEESRTVELKDDKGETISYDVYEGGEKKSSTVFSIGPDGEALRTTLQGRLRILERLDGRKRPVYTAQYDEKGELDQETFTKYGADGYLKRTTRGRDGSVAVSLTDGQGKFKGSKSFGPDGKLTAQMTPVSENVFRTDYPDGSSTLATQDSQGRTTEIVSSETKDGRSIETSRSRIEYRPDGSSLRETRQTESGDTILDEVDSSGALAKREILKEGRRTLLETREAGGYARKVFDDKGGLAADYLLDKDQNVVTATFYGEDGKPRTSMKVVSRSPDGKSHVQEFVSLESGEITREEYREGRIVLRAAGARLKEEYHYGKEGSSRKSEDASGVTLEKFDLQGNLLSSRSVNKAGELVFEIIRQGQGYLQTFYLKGGYKAERVLDEKFSEVSLVYYNPDGSKAEQGDLSLPEARQAAPSPGPGEGPASPRTGGIRPTALVPQAFLPISPPPRPPEFPTAPEPKRRLPPPSKREIASAQKPAEAALPTQRADSKLARTPREAVERLFAYYQAKDVLGVSSLVSPIFREGYFDFLRSVQADFENFASFDYKVKQEEARFNLEKTAAVIPIAWSLECRVSATKEKLSLSGRAELSLVKDALAWRMEGLEAKAGTTKPIGLSGPDERVVLESGKVKVNGRLIEEKVLMFVQKGLLVLGKGVLP